MSKAKITGMPWKMDDLWNTALHTMPERELKERSYMYASELGGSFVDRYLRMNGVKPTNPPNDRSKRKFSAGHVFEWIVGLVLTMTGVLKSRQLRGEYQLESYLPVSGRLDFIAGGSIDWDRAHEEVKKLQALFNSSNSDMPPIVSYAAEYILKSFEAQFKNNPLKEVVFECKSISSFMSDKLERTSAPMPHHVLQCVHYLLSNNMDEAYLFYISKDDMKAYQFSVFNDAANIRAYKDDVIQMTDYYNKGFDKNNPLRFAPPVEPEVIFDNDTYNFRTNYKIEYSNYLTLLYPQYQLPMQYREVWDKRVSGWNRVFKRISTEQNITAKNTEIIEDALKVFPNFEKLALKAKSVGAFRGQEAEID